MGVRNQNFEMWAGDDVECVFTIEDVDDLTGWSARWAMADAPHGEPLVTKTSTPPGGIAIDENKVTVVLVSQDTADLVGATDKPRVLYHELELSDPLDRTYTAAAGMVTVYPAVLTPAP